MTNITSVVLHVSPHEAGALTTPTPSPESHPLPPRSKSQMAIEALELTIVSNLEQIVADPEASTYSRVRALGTLNGIAKRQQKALDAKRNKRKARRQELAAGKADEARVEVLRNWLPNNNRLDPNWKPSAPVSDVDMWPDLDVINKG
jgi:hypothetical protein